MRINEVLKERILKRLKAGERAVDLSVEFGISANTLYNWKKNIEKENYENKISAFEKLLLEESYDEIIKRGIYYLNSLRVVYCLVVAYYYTNDFEKGIELASSPMYSDNEDIQYYLMYMYLNTGQYDKVQGIAKRFLNSGKIQETFIDLKIMQNKYDEAIRIALDFLSLFPEDRNFIFKLMYVYVGAGKIKEVMKLALENSTDEELQINTSYALAEKGYVLEAIKLLKPYADNPDYRMQIINLFVQGKMYDEALEFCESYLFDPLVIEQCEIINKLVIENKNKRKATPVNTVLNMIKENSVTYDELLEVIEDKTVLIQFILRSAYVDRNNFDKTNIINSLKYLMGNSTDAKEIFLIRDLINRLENKRIRIFDERYYRSLIQRAKSFSPNTDDNNSQMGGRI